MEKHVPKTTAKIREPKTAGKTSASGKTAKKSAGVSPKAAGKRRKIGVFFSASGADDYPLSEPEFRESYHQLGRMITDAGGECAIVRSPEAYRGNGAFDRAWIFSDGAFCLHDDVWEADVIFNKCTGSSFSPRDVRMVNPPDLEQLCTNKWETYLKFLDFFPESFLVQNPHELQWTVAKIKGELVVAKPLFGEGGLGITVAPAQEIGTRSLTFPLLIQTFLDTSGGIPGIAKGMHDLRIIAIRDVPVRSYVRQPKKGSYLANYALGGSLFEIPVESIPEDALALFRTVDTALRSFPDRVYSVDMGRGTDGRWQLIELNSKPGLDPIGPKYPSAEPFMRKLVKLLLTPGRRVPAAGK